MPAPMRKNEAEYLLGLCGSGSYDAAAVNSAYRSAAKETHPDVVSAAGGDVASAERRMVELNEARKFLLDMMTCLHVDKLPADAVHYGDVSPEPLEVHDFWTPATPPEPVPEPPEPRRRYSSAGFEFDNEGWDAWYAAQEAERRAAVDAAMVAPPEKSDSLLGEVLSWLLVAVLFVVGLFIGGDE